MLDSDGFLTIVDRYARFAKNCREMVSLAKIESDISEIVAEATTDDQDTWSVAASTIPDPKTGEAIGIIYTHAMTSTDYKSNY